MVAESIESIIQQLEERRGRLQQEIGQIDAAIAAVKPLLASPQTPPAPTGVIKTKRKYTRKSTSPPPPQVLQLESKPGQGVSNLQQRQIDCARVLLAGPMRYMKVGEATGIPSGTTYAVLNDRKCNWFTKNDDGEYELTPQGREAIENHKD